MYYLNNTTFPPGHDQNGFIATGALGHTHVLLGISKVSSSGPYTWVFQSGKE